MYYKTSRAFIGHPCYPCIVSLSPFCAPKRNRTSIPTPHNTDDLALVMHSLFLLSSDSRSIALQLVCRVFSYTCSSLSSLVVLQSLLHRRRTRSPISSVSLSEPLYRSKAYPIRTRRK